MIATKSAWQIKNASHDTSLAAYNILQFCLQKQLDFFLLVVIYLLFHDAMKKKHQLLSQVQLVHTKTNFVPYIYLSGNSDYEKLQNCIYYWQWTEKIYLFPLHVLATHRKIQKYFDFIRRSDQFSLIPKPHLETCRLLILCLFFIPQK